MSSTKKPRQIPLRSGLKVHCQFKVRSRCRGFLRFPSLEPMGLEQGQKTGHVAAFFSCTCRHGLGAAAFFVAVLSEQNLPL